MDRSAYASMSAEEGEHWWFVARRQIIASLIRSHAPRRPARRILEAGCGTGGNLSMLSEFGRLDAFEYDADARELAEVRSVCSVLPGALPYQLDLGGKTYDIVALLDVLEHVDDDVGSLRSLGARLNGGGRLILTVPAVPWLWSRHDELHHHKRRYTAQTLGLAVREAGLSVKEMGYFNSLLFPIAVGQRGVHRLFKRDAALDRRPAPFINALLRSIFAAERFMLPWLKFPIGLSLYAVVGSDRLGDSQ